MLRYAHHEREDASRFQKAWCLKMGTTAQNHHPLERLRAICLALPEAAEVEAWGEPTFRVRKKIFAMYSNNHHGDGIVAVWCKAPPGAQEVLIGADPARFYKPPYVGPSGWIGIRLEGGVDWGMVASLVEDAYRMTAPKRLLALLG